MESLRWILLAVGITFVLVIYFLGRSRRQRYRSMVDELEDNLPEFSAQSLDDVDEGVGRVRVITGIDADSDVYPDDKTSISASNENQVADENITADNQVSSDIIVLYILAKPEQLLLGSQINSSAQAMGLRFGEMEIFHFKRDGRKVFSLANMLEPGSFDANSIHDLKTSGLTVFMQIHGDDPMDDLTEMLQRSYQLAGLLNAVLCNHRRKPLTEQDAENYRTQVRAFIEAGVTELSSEH